MSLKTHTLNEAARALLFYLRDGESYTYTQANKGTWTITLALTEPPPVIKGVVPKHLRSKSGLGVQDLRKHLDLLDDELAVGITTHRSYGDRRLRSVAVGHIYDEYVTEQTPGEDVDQEAILWLEENA